MDKHLRPTRFDIEITSPNIEKEWKHWFRTFENFIGNLTFEGEAAAQQTAKLQTLTNYVSATVYEYISEAVTYNGAIEILKALYVKPKNVIYNRHKLLNHSQSEDENVDQFMSQLEQLSKHCDFTAVSAEQNRKEYIREAFINGQRSSDIQQRLLENNNISLDEAYSKARTLELAQKQSATYRSSSYDTPRSAGVSTTNDDNSLAAARNGRNNTQQQSSDVCFFCGKDRHPRRECKALNEHCNYCSKKGHFERVCKSKLAENATGSATGRGNVSAMTHPQLCATFKQIEQQPTEKQPAEQQIEQQPDEQQIEQQPAEQQVEQQPAEQQLEQHPREQQKFAHRNIRRKGRSAGSKKRSVNSKNTDITMTTSKI